MPELTKRQLTGIVTLAMVLGGIVHVSIPENTYYCESRDMVLECIRLSSTGKTCYIETGGKRCFDGWKPISEFIKEDKVSQIVTVNANDKVWKCNTHNGSVDSYTKCFSNEFEGYLGEFI